MLVVSICFIIRNISYNLSKVIGSVLADLESEFCIIRNSYLESESFLYTNKHVNLNGKETCNAKERDLIINQKFEEVYRKMIDEVLLKLCHKKRMEKSPIRTLFCSLCKEIVFNPPMASYVLCTDHLRFY